MKSTFIGRKYILTERKEMVSIVKLTEKLVRDSQLKPLIFEDVLEMGPVWEDQWWDPITLFSLTDQQIHSERVLHH